MFPLPFASLESQQAWQSTLDAIKNEVTALRHLPNISEQDIDHVDRKGLTLLKHAIKARLPKLILELIKKGARISLKDNDELSIIIQYPSVVVALMELRLKPKNATEIPDQQPLLDAFYRVDRPKQKKSADITYLLSNEVGSPGIASPKLLGSPRRFSPRLSGSPRIKSPRSLRSPIIESPRLLRSPDLGKSHMENYLPFHTIAHVLKLPLRYVYPLMDLAATAIMNNCKDPHIEKNITRIPKELSVFLNKCKQVIEETSGIETLKDRVEKLAKNLTGPTSAIGQIALNISLATGVQRPNETGAQRAPLTDLEELWNARGVLPASVLAVPIFLFTQVQANKIEDPTYKVCMMVIINLLFLACALSLEFFNRRYFGKEVLRRQGMRSESRWSSDLPSKLDKARAFITAEEEYYKTNELGEPNLYIPNSNFTRDPVQQANENSLEDAIETLDRLAKHRQDAWLPKGWTTQTLLPPPNPEDQSLQLSPEPLLQINSTPKLKHD